MGKKVGIGVIGSGFVADIHASAFRRCSDCEIVATASPTLNHVKAFALKHGIKQYSTDYRDLLKLDAIEVVSVGVPNHLHAKICIEAAEAGKHVIMEKPFAMNLREADQMISACRRYGVKLMYAEELCFAPKYLRAKELIDEGAIGKLYLIKQSEKHFGPHSDWFWDVEKSGGGVFMDMGCHALCFYYWVVNRRKPKSIYCHFSREVHQDKTMVEDNSIAIVEFEEGVTGLAEDSWARRGGMDDKAEFYGSEGVIYADLLMGSSLLVYSERGYGYAVEKAPTTKGWTYCIPDELWQYGFPQEMAHFIECVKEDKKPHVTGEDGRVVVELIMAGYHSAALGRKVCLPFSRDADKPINLWLKWKE